MSQSKLISIALATYNGEKFLRQQLNSILDQTYSNLEIIISDDASNDSTIAIINEYAAKDSRIKVFQNRSNLGLVKNFQNALQYCSGEYIALADQDDIWFPEKIDVLLHNIGDCLLIHSDAKLCDEEGCVFHHSYTAYSNKQISKTFIDYLFSNNLTGCTAMLKASLIKQHLPFPESIHIHDWWIAILGSYGSCIAYVDQPLLLYRQHGQNQIGALLNTNIPNFKQIEKNITSHLKMLRLIQKTFELDKKTHAFIKDLIHYHDQFFTQKIRFFSLIFHLKHFKQFHVEKPFLFRFFALILSLFGHSIQKILWPDFLIFKKNQS